MTLNDRKMKILQAIINDYIATAEPIGSRTIAKKYDLGISSATIRNEMSDLEDMGFIIQPHASAGRIPSDKGYRLYVDSMVQHRDLTNNEEQFFRQIIESNVNQIDYLMQETAKAISFLTNYTTIVSQPKQNKTNIKHLQLVPVDESSIAVVIVAENRSVSNSVISVTKTPDFSELFSISNVLNEKFAGKTLAEDDVEQILQMSVEASADNKDVYIQVYRLMKNLLKPDEPPRIFLSGTKNILAFPEFSDIEKAKSIFEALEERQMLVTILEESGNGNIKVLIGNENNADELKDCSVIKTTYTLDDNSTGSIGIIGPTRMNYGQAISILDGIAKHINYVLHAFLSG